MMNNPFQKFLVLKGARPYSVLMISGLLISLAGCWSETVEEPESPLAVPQDDPQIISRPIPELAVNDFAAVRHFRFHYDVTLTKLPPGERARIWVPLAGDTSLQRVTRELTEVPGSPQVQTEPETGNAILYTEAEANAQGEIPLKITYIVERVEGVPGGGEPVEADSEIKTPSAEIRVIYDKFLDETSENTENQNSELAPVSNFVKQTELPEDSARVECGLVLEGGSQRGAKPSAWAKVVLDGKWETVDLLSAIDDPRLRKHAFGTLSPDRIHLSSGENVPLVPPAKASSVANLLLPYVEVDGQPHTELAAQFTYEDVEAP